MADNKQFMCLICGKDFSDREPKKRQGALNLHKRACILKHLKVSEEPPKDEQSSSCSHEFRLLKTNIPIENRAIQKGFTEFCPKCQEVQ